MTYDPENGRLKEIITEGVSDCLNIFSDDMRLLLETRAEQIVRDLWPQVVNKILHDIEIDEDLDMVTEDNLHIFLSTYSDVVLDRMKDMIGDNFFEQETNGLSIAMYDRMSGDLMVIMQEGTEDDKSEMANSVDHGSDSFFDRTRFQVGNQEFGPPFIRGRQGSYTTD